MLSEKKYVLYIGAMVMPDQNAGAQRTMSLAKSIRDVGYTPVIIGLSYEENMPLNILETKKIYQGIESYAIPYPKTIKQWLKRMVSINEFCKIISHYGKNNIHSIIAIDYEVIALYRLRKLCNDCGIFLIADNMEWYEKSTLAFPKNFVKDLDTFWRMKIFYPKLKNKICISRYLYDYYSRMTPQFNTVLIPVTVDAEEGKWKTLPTYEPEEYIKIVYAGNPGDYCIKERLDWLIQAVCEINGADLKCQLTIIGVEQEYFETQYPQLTKYLEYHNVIYLGKKTHMECLRIISNSDFFTIIREDRLVTRAGFPTKLSEGLACGTPVITTPSSNITEYVVEGENGFITESFDYESLKKTLLRAVKTSRIELENMRKNCKNNMELDYRKFNEALADFFAELEK